MNVNIYPNYNLFPGKVMCNQFVLISEQKE